MYVVIIFLFNYYCIVYLYFKKNYYRPINCLVLLFPAISESYNLKTHCLASIGSNHAKRHLNAFMFVTSILCNYVCFLSNSELFQSLFLLS